MATKIRLQRHGRKSYAFYSIVIADVITSNHRVLNVLVEVIHFQVGN